MITLFYPSNDQSAPHFLQRLAELVVPHQQEVMEDSTEMYLKDGEKTFHGVQAIEEYLDHLEKEINAWRACTCDDWFI